MKLINYQSKTMLGFLWVEHTVLVEWDKVLSYEPIIFWRWKFYLYNRDTWEKQIRVIRSIQELPDINISQYIGIESSWIWCFEALIPILKQNNIDIMETVNNRIYNIIIIFLLIICTNYATYTVTKADLFYNTFDYVFEKCETLYESRYEIIPINQ